MPGACRVFIYVIYDYFCTPHHRQYRICQKTIPLQSVLIIGFGPIIIGQACEFDYSGSMGPLFPREEGVKVILINSNPATIGDRPHDGRLGVSACPYRGKH